MAKNKPGAQSEEVPADILKDFRAIVKSHPTLQSFLNETGMGRVTVKNLMRNKYCHPYTLLQINKVIEQSKQAAA